MSLVARLQTEVSGNYLQALVTYLTTPDPTKGLEDIISKGGATSEIYKQAYINVKQSIAEMDAFLLSFAAKGMNTDEALIIDTMCNKTKDELDAMDLAYRHMNDNKTLNAFVSKTLSGDLAEFLGYMQMNENEFDSYVLHKAFKGMGCDKDVVSLVSLMSCLVLCLFLFVCFSLCVSLCVFAFCVCALRNQASSLKCALTHSPTHPHHRMHGQVLEIFCTRSTERLQASRDYYEARKDSNLLDRVRKELSGDLEKLCIKLLSEPRFNPSLNPEAVATELYEHGEGKWGTNEAGFIAVFTSNSQAQLQDIANAYEVKYQNSLLAAVKSEFSGAMKTALTYLLMDPVDLTCMLLKKATVDKIGTDEAVVNRCIGGHDKKAVREIARRYFRYVWCVVCGVVCLLIVRNWID
jgi:hypothetical protein